MFKNILVIIISLTLLSYGLDLPEYKVVNIFEPKDESNVRSSFRIDEGIALIGTEETADIYKSSDNGMTWKKEFDAGHVYNYADVRFFIRGLDGYIYATSTRYGGILRSKNEGDRWRQVGLIPAGRSVGIIQLTNGVFIIGPRHAKNGKTCVFLSHDNCRSFRSVILPNKSQQNVTCFLDLGGGSVLAGIGFDGTAKVYKSTDFGKTWRITADFKGTYDIMDFIKIDNTIYTSTKSTSEIFKSTDNGETWQSHVRIWEQGFLGMFAKIQAGNREYLLLTGSDQTLKENTRHLVLISTDQGVTWQEWICLMTDNTGGASNIALISKDTFIVGCGNHSAQGKVFTVKFGENL